MKKKILLTPIALVASMLVSGVYAQDKVLSPVVISGQQDYIVESTSAVTRLDTPIQQIPQAIVALPKQVFEDQGSQTLSDALRNVSNVNTVDSRDQNNTGFKIRGFKAGLVVDGVPTAGFFHNHESLNNVETLAVVKGPSGDTYSGQGAGSQDTSGGTIYINTLNPHSKQSFSVTGTAGSYSRKGVSFDLNQPLNQSLALRVGAEKIDSDTNVDRIFFKRESMYAAIGTTQNNKRNVTLKFRSFDNSTLDYYGLPRASLSSNQINPAVARSTFFGANGQPEATTKGSSTTFNWLENISDDLSTNFIASKQSYKLSQPGTGFTRWLTGIGSWNTGYASTDGYVPITLAQDIDTTYLSPSITKKLNIGHVVSKLTAGFDYQKTTDNADFYEVASGSLIDPTYFPVKYVSQPWNYSTGLYPSWVDTPNALGDFSQRNTYTTKAPFISGQVDIDRLHLFYGLKRTEYETTQTGSTTNTSKNTSRVGASYDLTKQITIFAGSGESSRMPVGATFATGVVAVPEESKQNEVGVKFNSAYGLTGVISLFDLTKKNAPMSAGGFTSIQQGVQESQGLDLDLIWKVSNSWTNLLAYTNQQAKYKVDSSYAGKQLFLVPEETLRLATRYDFKQGSLAGLGLGFGLTYRSELPGDYNNTFFTPSITTYDTQLSYKLDKTTTVRFMVNNLFDKQYVEPMAYLNGGRVMPALPRTVMANATFSF